MQKKRKSEHYAKIEVDKSAFAREQKCHKVFDWQLIFFLSLVVQFRNPPRRLCQCLYIIKCPPVSASLGLGLGQGEGDLHLEAGGGGGRVHVLGVLDWRLW